MAVVTETIPLKWDGMLQTLFRFDSSAQKGTSDSSCPLSTTYKVRRSNPGHRKRTREEERKT
jgi:hypothetical protein